MNPPFIPLSAHFRRMYAWPRLRAVGVACGLWLVLFTFTWEAAYWILPTRIFLIGFLCLTAFGVVEVWPRRLPRIVARWALQVLAVAVAVPVAVVLGYHFTTLGLNPPWYLNKQRLEGVFAFIFLGMLGAPWIAVSALLGQIREDARQQAMRFELERSELARTALNARLSLLQAQVQPHFLFNTLANIRELVLQNAPQAPKVLDHLIAYLRSAVPRMDQRATTVRDELAGVCAYLEIMHMRMPDRLRYTIDASDAVLDQPCTAMSLMTLAENAVRHGIDPSEEGGTIEIRIELLGDHVQAAVIDTGVGLRAGPAAPTDSSSTTSTANSANTANTMSTLGTGIANLRERLRIAHGAEGVVELVANTPRGVRAVMRWPRAEGRL